MRAFLRNKVVTGVQLTVGGVLLLLGAVGTSVSGRWWLVAIAGVAMVVTAGGGLPKAIGLCAITETRLL